MSFRQWIVLAGILISTVSTGVAHAAKSYEYEVLLNRKDIIWSFDFLPDGRVIFTERSGVLAVFNPKTKTVQTITGAPTVKADDQGGLLEVRVHPDFEKNSLVYLSYSEPVGKKDATTAVGRGMLKGGELTSFTKIFAAKDAADTGMHFGSRIEFDGKGHIFVSIGERNERNRAQDINSHTGKIIRLNEDGSVPKDNPFVGKKNGAPEVWSYGQRNPQGLAYDKVSGKLWEAEMGPRGGDEINLIEPGKNYGWPVITYGREYYGPKIGTTEKAGMEQPVVYWVPSISPSGLAIYTGSAFPEWKGNLFLACLSGLQVRRVVVDDKGKVTSQEAMLEEQEKRFRAVRSGVDGMLWLTTDSGELARLKPTGRLTKN
ncbi:MAG: PQQ-dependent sugar dehydrogenase [Bdellovibrionota bacterium]